MSTPLRLALIGAGQRGADVYGAYALQHPDEVRFVAVADTSAARRERFGAMHDLGADAAFESWEAMLDQPLLADALVIATPDRAHLEPTLAALRAGYHVLLEKPMATTLADCVALVRAAEDADRLLQIGHVLRYTAFFSTVQRIVQSGRLGDVVTVEHRENVSYYHMAHSFVRGNWRRADESSPMILAKCCHDLDLLYWILGEPVQRLSSVGALRHFRPENAPHPDVPAHCLDGCPVEATCPFSAQSVYLTRQPWRARGGEEGTWPLSTLAHGDLSEAAIRQALATGPYGRCVYRCDNDVVDHQVVTMETVSGRSVALVMHGHSHLEGRTMRYDGTRATLRGRFTQLDDEITVHDHLTGEVERVAVPVVAGGHGGGDGGLVAAFLATLRGGEQAPLTNARDALESHLLAFAAEQARVERRVIEMDAFRAAAFG